ncbi:MAG: hypothetical protein A2741_01860 [Candidatus Zambryskibacteria bacterium RIFCSPHIGHO2_01_FULL_43_27]|uniref:Uncharacterized protein n=1 Tax=Candidatus Zambryskibacteria bacterium RIFCSPLOWO2_01_FULL_43_17 TaxID=1802760 RepID=A0A1G2U1A7_9BACT|nr:MAG: hypothetical protein A2741_01860 [Candidatus Zambryskibacteria bacterium RIFCSPHIGHO2_01_FULL_43_27]OHA99805.1 MAG: hypothetical protein A3E93_01075 [Candidatus Zambryskibacteria bacterium RIFCSPHIGHO2_12_FULL_43_12b]OHB03189.1 MAG: hypothetical protein A2920_02345 [Candidatus Zambryskibacteria bacterium RIFCSPLOWO2_01_FULL_43_17]
MRSLNTGFTLLETLIGVSILIIAITATFSATQNGLSSSIESKEQVSAYYLAQEAVELVRNVRDANSLYNIQNLAAPRNWLYGLALAGDACEFGKVCMVDALNNTFSSCATPTTCTKLNQDTNSSSATYGMYSYTSGANWKATNYKREIALTSINSNEVLITVTMTWSKGLYTKTFKIKETMLNWQS